MAAADVQRLADDAITNCSAEAAAGPDDRPHRTSLAELRGSVGGVGSAQFPPAGGQPAETDKEVRMSSTVDTATGVRPCRVEGSDEAIEDLRRRIGSARWPSEER